MELTDPGSLILKMWSGCRFRPFLQNTNVSSKSMAITLLSNLMKISYIVSLREPKDMVGLLRKFSTFDSVGSSKVVDMFSICIF